MYLSADDGIHGRELWQLYDTGQRRTGKLYKDLNPGPEGSYPRELTRLNNSRLYLSATDGSSFGRQLWVYDSTFPGDHIKPVMDTRDPKDLTAVGSDLYFRANGGSFGSELWKYDGASGSAELVKDINTTAPDGHACPKYFTAIRSTVYFSANDGIHGFELWKTDGTEMGTEMVQDIWPGPNSSYP